MVPKNQAALEPVRTLDAAAVIGTYVSLGTGLAQRGQIIVIVSTFDGDVWLSLDGVTDHILIPQGLLPLTLDVSANKNESNHLSFGIGTQFYVKDVAGAAPTAGNIAISVLYAKR